MAKKKQTMDKLSALNLAVPTNTRTQPAPAAPPSAPPADTAIVREATGNSPVVKITPPVFSDPNACTFTMFIDNMSAMMRIREVFNDNFLSINSMMVDSYKKTLTITFDAMRHNYSQFLESLKHMPPSAAKD
jgi:hypothetical protein